jgi:hypothetical protein
VRSPEERDRCEELDIEVSINIKINITEIEQGLNRFTSFRILTRGEILEHWYRTIGFS